MLNSRLTEPNERANSGIFLAPKNKTTTTTASIAQSEMLPIVVRTPRADESGLRI